MTDIPHRMIIMSEDDFDMIAKNTFDNDFTQELIERVRSSNITTSTPQMGHKCPLRAEVLAFALRMEVTLHKHDAKKGDSYKESDFDFLKHKLDEEVMELKDAVDTYGDTPYSNKKYIDNDAVRNVLSEGADVGNMAMMNSYIAYPSRESMINYINSWHLSCFKSHISATPATPPHIPKDNLQVAFDRKEFLDFLEWTGVKGQIATGNDGKECFLLEGCMGNIFDLENLATLDDATSRNSETNIRKNRGVKEND